MPKNNKLIHFFKKIKDNFGMLLLLVTIATFNVIIGANEKGLRVLPISILLAFVILYLIILKIKNKENNIFFKNKIDYLIFAFMLTTTLPLIFDTYASYSDTIEFMMKYFFIYAVYILARNCIKEKKHIEWIIVTTMICSFFSVIFFYDYFNTQYLKKFMKWIDITYNKNTMFFGTFGYANTQAIYSALCVFLAVHRFKENKNKILKSIDILYVVFTLYLIWLTDCRAVLLLLGLTGFILFVIKFRRQILKHKIIILSGSVFLIVCTSIFLSFALKIPEPIVKKDEDLKKFIKYNFKQNQKYTLELDLETISNPELENSKDNNFTIKVSEFPGCFFGKELFRDSFGEFNGRYKIEIIPTQDIDTLRLKIENNNKKGSIKLNECYINGEKTIINYKYIPNDLGFVLSGYTIGGKSLPQRIQMYKDCIKMIKDCPLVGHGGNTWKNLSLAYAEYLGALKESHSYFFELLISYGIIGFTAFYVFILYFFVKIIKQFIQNKEKRKEKLLIVLGLFLLLLHSLIDFNMSFMIIQLMAYICVAMLLYDEELENQKNNILEIGIIIFLLLILSLYVRADIAKYLVKDNVEKHKLSPYNRNYYNDAINVNINNHEDSKYILVELQNYIKKEPYFMQNENYERYFNLINQNMDFFSDEELENYLNFGIESIKKAKIKKIMYFDFVIRRTEIIARAINDFQAYLERNYQNTERVTILNNAILELKNIINTEYDTNISNLENFECNGYEEEKRENYIEKYQKLIEKIN